LGFPSHPPGVVKVFVFATAFYPSQYIMSERSAAVLDNNQQLAEKTLTATLSAVTKSANLIEGIPSVAISML